MIWSATNHPVGNSSLHTKHAHSSPEMLPTTAFASRVSTVGPDTCISTNPSLEIGWELNVRRSMTLFRAMRPFTLSLLSVSAGEGSGDSG